MNKIKKRIAIILCMTCFYCHDTVAQNIYCVTSTNDINELNEDGTFTLVHHVNLQSPLFDMFDIAIAPDNVFYAISGNSILKIEENSSYSVLTTLPSGGYNSLTCSSDYELYTINLTTLELVKYNILTNTTESVTPLGFLTPGDITFYRGNIIIPVSDSNKIRAYNLASGTLVEIMCLSENYGFLGITSVFGSCSETNIYAVGGSNSIYELDFETNQANNLNINSLGIFGMCSSSEYLSSECSYDFQPAPCSLSNPEYVFQKVTISPNPIDDVMKISSTSQIDKIEVVDLSGRTIKQLFGHTTEISMDNLAAGVYIIMVESEKLTHKIKIVKR